MLPVCIDNRPIDEQPHGQHLLEVYCVISRTALVLTALLLISVAGSDASSQHPGGSKTGTPDVTLTEQDNGKEIDLTTGTMLIVKLPGNPSTGYSWTVAGDPAPLRLRRTSFQKSSQKTAAMGRSGVAVFQLTAASAGLSNLTLVYRRSWEYNMAPAKTFSVRVDVR